MSETIIIKRQNRRKQKKEAGGAWKVAFADFTLAMMALFMVLWILAASNIDERTEFTERLRTYSVFDGKNNPFDLSNSPHPIDFGEDFSVLDTNNRLDPDAIRKSQKTARSLNQKTANEEGDNGYGNLPEMNSLFKGKVNNPDQLALLASELEAIADSISAVDNIEVEVVPQGLRILLRDDDDNKMFTRGSAMMTPFFQDVLRSLAPIFAQIDNRVMISGHTDSAQFHNAAFTNWELSSQRALQARQMLEIGGMPKQRVAQVVAMSDTMLIDKAQPKSSINRRIELLLLTEQAEQALSLLFNQAPADADTQAPDAASGNVINNAFEDARANRPVLRSQILLDETSN
ncbi:OmpA family protein [Thalassomonas actiniarum]|uniref:OmpA family protein n=1 Tax=Thalassomonas actiniarum TaxID=485447 RepID=A0AAE9YQ98_9GAMM|nr:OmpA family protein [Thalassomonas actiniarum]WDD99304.1 OmpA family protein [Thalassomonas actiniarum]